MKNSGKNQKERGLPNITVGEAHGTCPPETSGGGELKGAGVVLALLARRNDRSLVLTEAVAWRSAGRRCATTEPLTPNALRERVSYDPGDAEDRHHDKTRVAILEDETPDRREPHPLQNERNSVREDGEEAVAEETVEDPVYPPRNRVELHLARRVERVEDDRSDRQSPRSEEQVVRIPAREEGVGHRHHEADHEVQRPHEEHCRSVRQLPGEVSDPFSDLHFMSPFLSDVWVFKGKTALCRYPELS